MQKCKNCGADIRYVAVGPDENIVCDNKKILFVTEFGRKTYGYLVHKCEEKENEQRTNDSGN